MGCLKIQYLKIEFAEKLKIAWLNPLLITATIQKPEESNLQTHLTYRYAFNGMEKDDELKGDGNSYDFGARIYDSRLGRFLSTDPLQMKFPSLSPYVFAGNNPIRFIDKNGEAPGNGPFSFGSYGDWYSAGFMSVSDRQVENVVKTTMLTAAGGYGAAYSLAENFYNLTNQKENTFARDVSLTFVTQTYKVAEEAAGYTKSALTESLDALGKGIGMGFAVYDISVELTSDPTRMEAVQRLTIDWAIMTVNEKVPGSVRESTGGGRNSYIDVKKGHWRSAEEASFFFNTAFNMINNQYANVDLSNPENLKLVQEDLINRADQLFDDASKATHYHNTKGTQSRNSDESDK